MNLRIAALVACAGLVVSLAGCGGDSGPSEDKAGGDASPSASATTATPSGSAPATPPAGTPGGESPSPDVTGPPPQRLPGTPPPNRPPQKPTDTVTPGWVVGTVTGASSGPCYGMVTDDGTAYALYTSKGFAVRRGERIRVRVEELKLKIYCGPGRHAAVKEYEKVT